MRIITWIIGLPVAALATAFAVANRQVIDVDLWPLPMTVSLGLYLAVLGALALGLITGLLMGWLSSSSKKSARAKVAQAKVQDLQSEIAQLRSQIPEPTEHVALPQSDAAKS